MSEDRPFIWNGNELSTIGNLIDAIAAVDEAGEARRFMDEYRAVNEHADSNVGYVIGYIEPAERRHRLYRLFSVGHPVTGQAI